MKHNLSRLQKEILMVLSIIIVLIGMAVYDTHHVTNEYPGMIRLHVIANSDTPEDQIMKKKVRNEILTMMEGQTTIEGARKYIDTNITDIEEKAKAVIEGYGGTYGVVAERKVTFIPEKSYEDLTLPAGNYEALQITLGEGKGQNWWCVIFPQLCLIGEDAGGEKLILKSKIKEMLKEQQEERAVPAS